MKSRRRIALALLAFVPLCVAAERLGWGDGAVFLCSALAILPLAVWLSTATEELSIALGPSIGALLNALFGNATELIIALVALKAGLTEIVKASITGTVMANLLLALGLQQKVTNVTMNQSLAKALRDILNSTESLDRTSKELNKTVKAIPTNRELLTEIKRNRPRSLFGELD